MTALLQKRILNIVQYLLLLGVGLVLLWLSFRNLDMHLVWQDIREAHYFWLILSLLVALISHYCRALRWNLLINSMGYQTHTGHTFFAVMVGYMANTAVPRMGEFMRCGVLSRKENIPFNALFGTVISERLFDLIILLLIILSVIIFQFTLLENMLQNMVVHLAGSSESGLLYPALFLIALIVLFVGALWFVKYKKAYFHQFAAYRKLSGFIHGLLDGIKTIVRLKQKGLFLLYTFFIWVAYIGMVYLPFYMFPDTIHLTILDALTLMSIGSLGIVAPVPGGIGTYHFIVKAVLFELYHINPITAGSFAAITHAGQTFINVTTGALGYFYLTLLTKRQKPTHEKIRTHRP